MVRTYAFNASSRSDVFEQYKHTAATPLHQNNGGFSRRSQDTISPSYSDSRIKNNESPMAPPIQQVNQQQIQQNYQNSNSNDISFPPIDQSSIYQSSFHSSMIDPIGSIVGLRLIHMNGQLVYVPVEPQLNFLINKHFGSSNTLPVIPQLPNPMIQSLPPIQQYQQPKFHDDYQIQQQNQYQQPKTDWNDNYTPNRKPSTMHQSGSLPNLSQKPVLSLQEQHKLDLAKQIEDNKRRREAEKQKEYEQEQREIRRWEEYQKRIQDEEEREKRAIKEKAMAMERRHEQICEQQRIDAENRKYEQRRQSYAKPQQQQSHRQNTFDEEPIRPQKQQQSERRYSNSEYTPNPQTRSIRQETQTPPQQEYQPRPDSSQPREIEWWEKKPAWQERMAAERKSAAIPTLRGKPPAVPDSQRSSSEVTSRPSSRTTQTRGSNRITMNENEIENQTSNMSSENLVEVPKRTSAAKIKAPTAFTISA